MDFNLKEFHFAHPLYLWLLLCIPVVLFLVLFFHSSRSLKSSLEKFIDPHLIPYLLIEDSGKKKRLWIHLLFWSIVWFFLTLAIAGPRWSFREVETFSKDQSLVIALDLSESMNAEDIRPSRLTLAKQKIEDILSNSQGIKIGLIAFAADAHMLAPLTEDKKTIRHLLPSIQTDLVYIQGSKLTPVLSMASVMLENEPGNNKALLIISDGGIEDSSAMLGLKKLKEKGITIHTMGVGTVEGAPLKDRQGNRIKKGNVPTLTKLEKNKLKEISQVGQGLYLEARYAGQEEMEIVKEIEKKGETQQELHRTSRFWDERFYLFVFPVLPVFLWWFRQGSLFVLLFFCFPLKAGTFNDYLLNAEEKGKELFYQERYAEAAECFEDPYKKGVACYKNGQFDEAEKMFKECTKKDTACSATYNLGNSLAQQQKYKEAIKAYEDVLEQWPNHLQAKENLEIVKKMLKEQQKQEKKEKNSDSSEDQEKQKDNEENKNQENSKKSKDQPEQKDNEKEQNQENSEKEEEKEEEDQKPATEEKEMDSEKKEKQKEEEKASAKPQKSEEEEEADQWLNGIQSDPKNFLKNKFYVESKKNGTTEGIDPW